MWLYKCYDCMCEFDVSSPTKTVTVTEGVSSSGPVGYSMPKTIKVLTIKVNYCPSCKSENIQVVPEDVELRKRLGYEH